jgi:ubiquinone/menaquinone biosynthesis C-methylase UbiE
MTASSSTSQYVLGSTDAEHERLIRQAARLDPYTERLFRDAGIGPGHRVLDIGSGVGDVAMLVARDGRQLELPGDDKQNSRSNDN